MQKTGFFIKTIIYYITFQSQVLGYLTMQCDDVLMDNVVKCPRQMCPLT
jgi:hypothetical protein